MYLTDFLVESSPILKRKYADERKYKDDGECQDVLDIINILFIDIIIN